jgi:2-polyprenyl-3-methyl-5-hydroxy-6-metoxy-1,4-benzoquinol methylase
MDENDLANRTRWEKRGKLYGASLRSVLFKGMPEYINEHIGQWHRDMILNSIENKKDMKILDIGCGYGRLSLEVLKRYPDSDMLGIDTSQTYVELYQQSTKRPAMVATIEELPANIGQFDYILCVTVLMYAKESDVRSCLKNLISHLKPNGRLLLLEPQTSMKLFLRLGGLVDFLQRASPPSEIDTGGRYFRRNELEEHIAACDCKIESCHGLPITSFVIVPLNLLSRIVPVLVTTHTLKLISWLDRKLGKGRLPSMYYAYTISRNRT